MFLHLICVELQPRIKISFVACAGMNFLQELNILLAGPLKFHPFLSQSVTWFSLLSVFQNRFHMFLCSQRRMVILSVFIVDFFAGRLFAHFTEKLSYLFL